MLSSASSFGVESGAYLVAVAHGHNVAVRACKVTPLGAYLPRSAMRRAISLSLRPTMASPRFSESAAMSAASA